MNSKNIFKKITKGLKVKIYLWFITNRLIKPNKLHYIGGGESIPPPLDHDEETKLIKELANGSKTARQTLIKRNLRLVLYIAKKFENPKINLEDLMSIGTIGLIKAVNTFDSEKNTKIATYASKCIENEILMYLRKNNCQKIEISIDEPLNVDWDGNELLLSEILGTDNDVTQREVENEIDKELLILAIQKLTLREKRIMELRFGLKNNEEEKTQKEVADMLGISQSYISRLEKRIIARLRKYMKQMIEE
ncbi:MAG: RNA polymerase sporulation sigma factor SigE [Clostridiales bacterium]|jgi:RNA polymerase sporulation-specific sigma factor|nr:RNA polymerase sporulation sigma factor SigE [Clostridiales bacterium]